MDAGVSTGGFADCLLQRGAASVVGVDVGYGQVRALLPFTHTCAARGNMHILIAQTRQLLSQRCAAHRLALGACTAWLCLSHVTAHPLYVSLVSS